MANKVHYINLDSASDRKAAIESSFQNTLPHGWKLERVSATVARDVENVPGNISPVEKACFLSHQKIIQSTLESGNHEMIVEDDCVFSRNAFRIVDDLTSGLDDKTWDLLFLEVGIGDTGQMIDLKMERNRLAAERQISLLKLSKLSFFGSLSYVVNKNSKRKILQCLSKFTRLDLQYDLALRHLIHGGELNGLAVFPFITTPSTHAKNSSIQKDETQQTDEILILFRNLMFMDRDVDEIAARVADLERRCCDTESRVFGGIVAARVSPQFKVK